MPSLYLASEMDFSQLEEWERPKLFTSEGYPIWGGSIAQSRQWLVTQGLNPNDPAPFLAHLEKGALQEKERLSSMPFYANKAKKYVEQGKDEMEYWRGLFRSRINSLIPPKTSSTPAVQ